MLSYRPVPITGTGHAVTVVGEDCKESDVSNGCAVYVNGARGWFTTSHGIVDRAPMMRLTSTGREKWLGGITSVSDTGTCSVMLRSWRVKWRTCDNRFSDISPDNDHVLGLPAYGDGFGPTVLDVLATTDGSVARTFRSPTRGAVTTYFDEVWEDAEHVLVVTYRRGVGGGAAGGRRLDGVRRPAAARLLGPALPPPAADEVVNPRADPD